MSRLNKSNKKKQQKKGGSLIADASVPAGLFLLHRYLKNRKSRKVAKKLNKKRTRKTK